MHPGRVGVADPQFEPLRRGWLDVDVGVADGRPKRGLPQFEGFDVVEVRKPLDERISHGGVLDLGGAGVGVRGGLFVGFGDELVAQGEPVQSLGCDGAVGVLGDRGDLAVALGDVGRLHVEADPVGEPFAGVAAQDEGANTHRQVLRGIGVLEHGPRSLTGLRLQGDAEGEVLHHVLQQ